MLRGVGSPECPEQLELLLEYGLDGFHPNTLSLLAASLQQVVLVPGIDGPGTHREPARVVVLFLHHRETVDCVWGWVCAARNEYSGVWHSTVWYDIVQCSMIQCNAAHYGVVWYAMVYYNTVMAHYIQYSVNVEYVYTKQFR